MKGHAHAQWSSWTSGFAQQGYLGSQCCINGVACEGNAASRPSPVIFLCLFSSADFRITSSLARAAFISLGKSSQSFVLSSRSVKRNVMMADGNPSKFIILVRIEHPRLDAGNFSFLYLDLKIVHQENASISVSLIQR